MFEEETASTIASSGGSPSGGGVASRWLQGLSSRSLPVIFVSALADQDSRLAMLVDESLGTTVSGTIPWWDRRTVCVDDDLILCRREGATQSKNGGPRSGRQPRTSAPDGPAPSSGAISARVPARPWRAGSYSMSADRCRALRRFLAYYNRRRPHAGLKYEPLWSRLRSPA